MTQPDLSRLADALIGATNQLSTVEVSVAQAKKVLEVCALLEAVAHSLRAEPYEISSQEQGQ